jgi:tripartite-type tricarboxylate transporter receptor subunit TctC
MKRYRSSIFTSITLAILILASFTSTVSAAYPEKMVQLIVVFGAGGGTDRWARIMSSGAIDNFGQPWHVVNIPGSDGIVGWKTALNKPADGYTIVQGSSTPVIALVKEEKPPISPYDIKICCYVSAFRSVLVSKPGKPYSTWEGLVKYAKENPGKLTVGGSQSNLLGQANLFDQAGLEATMVPYDATANAVSDFLGGHLDLAALTFTSMATIVPDQAVAVINSSDIPITKKGFEKIPSAEDFGYEGMSFPRWLGVHPDTPEDIVKAISDKTGKLLKDKSVARLIKKIGEEIIFVPYPEVEIKYKNMVEGMKRAVKLLQ